MSIDFTNPRTQNGHEEKQEISSLSLSWFNLPRLQSYTALCPGLRDSFLYLNFMCDFNLLDFQAFLCDFSLYFKQIKILLDNCFKEWST